jgi:midasin (ATPase involved in ribosome maturation)
MPSLTPNLDRILLLIQAKYRKATSMSDKPHTGNWSTTVSRALEFFPSRGISRILLHGVPGTGKTSLVASLMTGRYSRVQLDQTTEPESLFVFPQIENGDTKFVDGQVTEAMRHGFPLLLDEIDKHGVQCQSALHAILDDPALARIVIPTGEIIRPTSGFGVIATMNGQPADLPEPIIDRFDVVIACNEPHSDILSSLRGTLSKFIEGVYSERAKGVMRYEPQITTRRMIVVDRLISSGMSQSEALRFVFHDLASEIETALTAQSL